MFEPTKHQDEPHVDERAHNFFKHFRGCSAEGSMQYSWDSCADGIRPTSTIDVPRSRPVCAFCGRMALPIQKAIRFEFVTTKYVNKGYCCVCKDAMDELELIDKQEEVKAKMSVALSEIESAKPKVSVEVLTALIEKEAARKTKELAWRDEKWGIFPGQVSDAGFKLLGPKAEEEEEEY